jgi:two-component system OmpR family response regulator
VERLIYDTVEVDRLKHTAARGGDKLDLTPREYRLLEHFMLNPERVVRRTELLEKVWDMSFDPMSNVIDVHVANLRQKLRAGGEAPLIHTVRGVGYVLQAGDDRE